MESIAEQLTDRWLDENLPKLRADRRFKITSRHTWDYNCVGLVVGDYRWWHPDTTYRSHHWPENLKPNGLFAKAYIEALATVGFAECRSSKFIEGFQIAAVFHVGGKFTHIATQIAPDVWKSKLGQYEDVEHSLEKIVERGAYGKVFAFLTRPLPKGYSASLDEYRLTSGAVN